jgi:hypothetical protein
VQEYPQLTGAATPDSSKTKVFGSVELLQATKLQAVNALTPRAQSSRTSTLCLLITTGKFSVEMSYYILVTILDLVEAVQDKTNVKLRPFFL